MCAYTVCPCLCAPPPRPRQKACPSHEAVLHLVCLRLGGPGALATGWPTTLPTPAPQLLRTLYPAARPFSLPAPEAHWVMLPRRAPAAGPRSCTPALWRRWSAAEATRMRRPSRQAVAFACLLPHPRAEQQVAITCPPVLAAQPGAQACWLLRWQHALLCHRHTPACRIESAAQALSLCLCVACRSSYT